MKNRNGRVTFFALLSVALLLFGENVLAANHYILAGGAGDGSSWGSPLGTLPDSLIRGDIYYIGDGTYGAKTFSTPEEGAKLIIIKKATLADHGTDEGWISSYGDGVASFTGTLTFKTSYWEFDGGLKYGFKLIRTRSGYVDEHYMNVYGNNIKVANVEIMGPGWKDCHLARGIQSTGDNLVFDACYIHNFSAVGIRFSGGANIEIKNCHFHNIRNLDNSVCYNLRGSQCHFEDIALFDGTENVSIHDNVFSQDYTSRPQNVEVGYGVMMALHGGYLRIYNNIFFNLTYPIWLNSDGWGNLTDFYVYGNTFVGYRVATTTNGLDDLKNNIFCNLPSFFNNDSTRKAPTVGSYNLYCYDSRYVSDYKSASHSTVLEQGICPFKDCVKDWRLVSPTDPGYALPEPYNKDIVGVTRGTDGNWDRGAYEYKSSASAPTSPNNLTIIPGG